MQTPLSTPNTAKQRDGDEEDEQKRQSHTMLEIRGVEGREAVKR